MRLRTFHQLNQGGLTGLEIFHNWKNSPKKPISSTDISLIFNGEEYADTEMDFVAFGDVLTPCLTAENLSVTFENASDEQVCRIKRVLSVPTEKDFLEWLESKDAERILFKILGEYQNSSSKKSRR